jgi:pyruvate dehydrogenase E2 component (dihydrolipoamide acetyltransferase)
MTTTTDVVDVTVPDIGDFADVPIIEVHVSEGDVVAQDDPLITLESDKATMDVPASAAGTVASLAVSVGDRVGEGGLILRLAPAGGAASDAADDRQQSVDTAAQAADLEQQELSPEAVEQVAASAEASASRASVAQEPATTTYASSPSAPAVAQSGAQTRQPAAEAAVDGRVHAGPGVRRLARELGVDLSTVPGTGPKQRTTKQDLLAWLQAPGSDAAAPPVAVGGGIPQIPAQDFAKFGPVEIRPLPRIKAISGSFLHRSWLNVPHVTQHDEADITELEGYRKELDAAARAQAYRVTLLAFLMKASVSGLRQFPEFNSSLSPDQGSLIYKSYYHLGVAVDTPGGLVVPVIRDVDRKGVTELSRELGETSKRARRKALPRRHAGRDFHDLQPRRHRRHSVHPDCQRAGGGRARRRAREDGSGVER